MEAHCPYLKRKIRSNAVSTRDLVETFFADNLYIPFSHRAIDMLDKYRGNTLFISKWHKAAFETVTKEVSKDWYSQLRNLIIKDYVWIQKTSCFVTGFFMTRMVTNGIVMRFIRIFLLTKYIY